MKYYIKHKYLYDKMNLLLQFYTKNMKFSLKWVSEIEFVAKLSFTFRYLVKNNFNECIHVDNYAEGYWVTKIEFSLKKRMFFVHTNKIEWNSKLIIGKIMFQV